MHSSVGLIGREFIAGFAYSRLARDLEYRAEGDPGAVEAARAAAGDGNYRAPTSGRDIRSSIAWARGFLP